jgi:hypothetical protein
MLCETDYLYLSFFMKYQGQIYLFNYELIFCSHKSCRPDHYESSAHKLSITPSNLSCDVRRASGYNCATKLSHSGDEIDGAVHSFTLSRDIIRTFRRNGT